ncbi:hypothetical protein GCM10010123_19700 [Pilimelia anulata]|uniref:Uncharacterized protein n=1 Tax=Pilimelia anulata TaxID=53371 RepID=A0A8J3F9X3_9ACTN|nr:hypothetical protein [Pilimelia anulata]GGJ89943.1 hypothetical protein GCM10010123_19700 [Pilimelia anulata]
MNDDYMPAYLSGDPDQRASILERAVSRYRQSLAETDLDRVADLLIADGLQRWLNLWPHFTRLLFSISGPPTPASTILIGPDSDDLDAPAHRDWLQQHSDYEAGGSLILAAVTLGMPPHMRRTGRTPDTHVLQIADTAYVRATGWPGKP